MSAETGNAAREVIAGRQHRTLSFRPDIEGLRAIAVLSVVAYHFGVPGVSGGFVGVDVFFVISGYLITSLLVDEIDGSGSVDLARFYGRRARRLFPAAAAMTLTVILGGLFLLSPVEQWFSARAGVFSSIYLANIWLAHQTFDYFAPQNALNPFLHMWSLSVEEQFYLIWPALLLWNRRMNRASFLVGIGFISTISFIGCIWLSYTARPLAFYIAPTRVWEFGIGAILCLQPVTKWVRDSRSWPLIGWLALILLIASFFWIDDLSQFPGPDAAIPALATGCVLLSASKSAPTGSAGWLLGRFPLRWIGSISYSVYLWHWPILVFSKTMWPPLGVSGRIGCFITTLAIAELSYRAFERPIRNSRYLASRSIRSICLGASLTMGMFLLCSGSGVLAQHFEALPTQARILKAATYSHPHCPPPNDSLPCMLGGSPDGSKTIVLFGDSHAGQWFHVLDSLGKALGWRIVPFVMSSCPVADVPVYYHRQLYRECANWRIRAIRQIVRLHPDLVVVEQFSTGYEQRMGPGWGEQASNLRSWSVGLKKSLQALAAAKAPVLFMQDNPRMTRDTRTCLSRADWFDFPSSACDTSRALALDKVVTSAERKVTGEVPGVHFIDIVSKFCSQRVCPALIDGTVVYADGHHLSVAYTIRLRNVFADIMTEYLSGARLATGDRRQENLEAPGPNEAQ